VTPGQELAWTVPILNSADQPAVVDGYELAGKSAGLDLLGAAGVSYQPGLNFASVMDVNDALRAAVADHPLAGWTSEASTSKAFPDTLVFLLQANAVGDYALDSIMLRYHIGSQSFSTEIPASLEVCVGAAVAAGSTCPFARPSPGN